MGREGMNGIVLPVYRHGLQCELQLGTALDAPGFLSLNDHSLGASAFGDDRFAFDHHGLRNRGAEMVPRFLAGRYGLVQSHMNRSVLGNSDGVGAPNGGRSD